MYIDDVRNPAISRYGATSAASGRVCVCYFHELRIIAENSCRWTVLHAEGLHKRCCIRSRRIHLHSVDHISLLDAEKSAKQFDRSIADDTSVCATTANIHTGATHAKSGVRIVSRFQRDPVSINVAHSINVCIRQLRCTTVWRQVRAAPS